jgi:hypothetical protein
VIEHSSLIDQTISASMDKGATELSTDNSPPYYRDAGRIQLLNENMRRPLTNTGSIQSKSIIPPTRTVAPYIER